MNTFKKLLIINLIINIFFSTSVYAFDVQDVWDVQRTTRQNLETTVEAVKTTNVNGVSTTIKSSATLLPLAANLGKMLLKTGITALVILAIDKAIDLGSDYVNDASNFKVKFKDNDSTKSSEYYWFHPEFDVCYGISSCNKAVNKVYKNADCQEPVGNTMRCNLRYTDAFGDHGTYANLGKNINEHYEPAYVPQDRSLTYNEIGQIILDNAIAGNPAALDYVHQTADTALLNSNDLDQPMKHSDLVKKLEKNAQYPSDTKGKAETKPKDSTNASSTNPNPASSTSSNSNTETTTEFELPEFCKYATTLCKWLEWTKDDDLPDEPDTKVQIKTNEDVVFTPYSVSFGGSCPASITTNLSFFGNSVPFEISFESLCTLLLKIRPFFIGSAYLIAVYILSGLRSKE
jgi:hypothetical protein